MFSRRIACASFPGRPPSRRPAMPALSAGARPGCALARANGPLAARRARYLGVPGRELLAVRRRAGIGSLRTRIPINAAAAFHVKPGPPEITGPLEITGRDEADGARHAGPRTGREVTSRGRGRCAYLAATSLARSVTRTSRYKDRISRSPLPGG